MTEEYCTCNNYEENIMEDNSAALWVISNDGEISESIFYPRHTYCKDCGKKLKPYHLDGCYVKDSKDKVMLSLISKM